MPVPLPHEANYDAVQLRASQGRRILRTCWISFLIVAFDVVVGTAWHEIVGHGLTAVAFGARITYVEVVGFQLFPEIRWVGATGYFGYCGDSGVEGDAARALILLDGSLSTWLVGVTGACLLYLRRWRGWVRILIIALSLWWLDLLLYTLPSLGIPRYLFWGHRYSEPYEAAVALGVPGHVFQSLVLMTSAVLGVTLGRNLVRRDSGCASTK